MVNINLRFVIEDVIARFSRNRIGDKPPIFVTASAALPNVPWHDLSLKKFVKTFLYEALLSNDPAAPLEVSLRRRPDLNDLDDLLGIETLYWVQLSVSGNGLRMIESLVDDLATDAGYQCEEWIAVEGLQARLGIFGSNAQPDAKMVFCVDPSSFIRQCDLLFPIVARAPFSDWAAPAQKLAACAGE